jgi:hypothetical protein
MNDESRCVACGAKVAAEEAFCPGCGAEAGQDVSSNGRWGETTRRLDGQIPEGSGAATLFQPGIMMEDLLGETSLVGAPTPPSPTASDGARRGRLSARFEVPAYFLLVGAPPGFERIELTSACTVVGREGADLVLDDAKISSHHCQIDVLGREFYVRDLDSLNGTFLNGHEIRSSQILPGDTLRLGNTSLVFCVGSSGGEE